MAFKTSFIKLFRRRSHEKLNNRAEMDQKKKYVFSIFFETTYLKYLS